MFFLTRERQEVFNAAHTYPFGESFDADIAEHLYEQLTEFIDVFPQKFQSGIIEQTLFRNDTLMNEFEEWCNVTIEQFRTKSHAIYEKREAIVEHFHATARTVFSKSFHDGEILNAEQQGNKFMFLLDMSGGFMEESIVQLVFHDAQTEGILEGFYIYDELLTTEAGFALRVLSSYGSPYAEWTIFFKDVTANALYRPAVYIEPGEIATWDEYVAALNSNDTFYIVKDMRFVEIDFASLSQTENGIFAGGLLLGGTFEEARERIYCATYEDPYAHLSEPIPTDELLSAMFDEDQNLRVRAFNTIFALGESAAYIVNEALRKVEISTDENMYFSIIASHFHQLGCLEDDVKLKWLRELE
ncbi:hypothetical protein J2Z40_003666 [Cytobacillus eiseniae]|uniref:Group-specific protein n=1 Tax=Cytobacillus eiseniae TaxID=762947 RepID=A0ABS4RJL6_9BACI|nr:DUF4085 family protein [Cytobacillus eiseniae]MBP2243078.1 hypothetical protein [Cytobacillus eiseniae]